MTSINKSVLFFAALNLLVPINSYADIKIILGSPYNNYKYSNYYNPANNYAQRHNFGNNRFPTNPYLNNNFSYYANQNRNRQIITSPNIGFGINSFYSNSYGNKFTNNKFNRIYQKGYQQGYNDAKNSSHHIKGFKLGK